ncbi:MAG: trypsin-like peptidase domain-containing protein [Tepidanaerobacteraceae bacterium]|jgi:Do/DeqQ family serine protease|nr:trypsin-like peptidase domain-containing protein [Tepidanaerobacteraceae bacterium]
MIIFNKHKYLIAVLLGLALGAALVVGGISAYNMIYPSNSAKAGIQGTALVNTSAPETALPTSIPDIVDNVSNAVVYIETTVESNAASNPFLNDPFFRQFFGDDFGLQPKSRVSKGVGSGFIINADGYILTNEHVIDNAKEVNVTVKGFENPFKATVVGKDFDLDLAVLKINSSKKLPYLNLGNSDSMRVGEWVIAIGNPYRLDHTVTVGVISAKGRPVTISDESSGKDRVYKNLIQTDAAINPGNSGGPLISLNGDVIGINTAINAQAQGIGFAIPINTAKEVLNDLIKNGSITRPYIGVGLQDLTKDLVDYFKLKDQNGAIITYVYPDSPAEKAGLQQGDVIIKINETTIKNSNDVVETVSKAKVNDKMVLVVYRNGQTLYISLVVGKKPQ